MQIDRIYYPIESLGPGKRLVVWTVGCGKHCHNCSNQELWEKNESRDIDVDALMKLIYSSTDGLDIEGITITGGDPFEQHEELLKLVKQLSAICDDILVYTGYTEEELCELLTADELSEVKKNIGVLIDGRYIDAENDNAVPLRGSVNQKIIFNKSELKGKYGLYIKQGRKIQNVYGKDKIVSIGIHNKEGEMK